MDQKKANHNLPDEFKWMDDEAEFGRETKNVIKIYKQQKIVKSHERQCPEWTWNIEVKGPILYPKLLPTMKI